MQVTSARRTARVESLSTETTALPGTAHEPDWEQSALLALRRHLRDRKTD